MRNILLLALLGAATTAAAEDGWKGAGELGLALSRGNSETESLNAKLGLSYEDAQWKHSIGFAALRQKGQVADTDELDLTANRYELSGSSAYTLSERSYAIGSLRYENDDFAPYDYQTILSLGLGWYAIKNEVTEWLFEGGPGYRRYQDAATGQTDGQGVFRGRMNFKHAFNASTSVENSLLVEAGTDNTFAQNDSGLVVKMNASLALKAGLQFRHNSDVAPGLKKTDSLFTTNLVYSF
jgi:putative salt-induced outer membrane protein